LRDEWFEGDHYETLAICRTLALARAAFAVEERPAFIAAICNIMRCSIFRG
jgi:hypothetical protein